MVKYVKIVCANAQYCNLYCHEGHGTYWESFKVWLVAALVLICLNRSQGICHPILVPWSETKNGPREMSPAEPPEEIQQSGSAFLFSAFFAVGLIIALRFEWWKRGGWKGSMYESLGEKNALMKVFLRFFMPLALAEEELRETEWSGFGWSI